MSRRFLTLGEFLVREGFTPGQRSGKALMQTHCHEYAILDAKAARSLVERSGLELEVPDSGCCGMAGSFQAHYDISSRLAERVILPKVRAADPSCIIIADGFSCREQIRQGSGRRPVHLAEVLAEPD